VCSNPSGLIYTGLLAAKDGYASPGAPGW